MAFRFFCTQCSHCCRHESGFVFLCEEDLERLSERFSLSREEFEESYCIEAPFGPVSYLSLKEKENYDCIFWADGGCAVYEDRPIQCRTYPFWSHITMNDEQWKLEGRECPGIGIGPISPEKEVESIIKERKRCKSVMVRGGSGEI